jgi:hypothetical protein
MCCYAIEQILKHISELEPKNFGFFLKKTNHKEIQSSVRPFQFLADFPRGEEEEEMAADSSASSSVSSASHNILFSRDIHLHPTIHPIKPNTCIFKATVK